MPGDSEIPGLGRRRKRGRARLTMPSKKRQRTTENNAEESGGTELERRKPKPKEYETWGLYRSFVVKDENDEPVKFEIGGCGLIVPEGAELRRPDYIHDYWIGVIKEIRSPGADPTEVWAKVQWLWSANDIVLVDKTIDISPFGRMERFVSTACDFVHSSCFQDVARVKNFDDSDTEPPLITDETFYVRYSFDHIKKRISPKVEPTCLCGIPYNPDASSTMHFCPRKKCRKAYHANCLKKHGWAYTDKPPPTTLGRMTVSSPNCLALQPREVRKKGKTRMEPPPRTIQFERTLPSSSLQNSLKAVPPGLPIEIGLELDPSPDSTIMDDSALSRTPRRSNKHKNKSAELLNRYKHLPPALLALARSPMIRGIPNTASTSTAVKWEEYDCVSGNVAFVSRARKIVERVVMKDEVLTERGRDGWFEELGLPKLDEINFGTGNKQVEPENEDEASSSIEEQVMHWVVDDEGLLCPSCGGVI